MRLTLYDPRVKAGTMEVPLMIGYERKVFKLSELSKDGIAD